MIRNVLCLALLGLALSSFKASANEWVRINLAGYKPAAVKVAVWDSRESRTLADFVIVDKHTGKVAFRGSSGAPYGPYGPFSQTYRLDFSALGKPGLYVVRAGDATSPEFRIGDDVYDGAADFAMKYMRQQGSGYNPYLRDSCHTADGYTMYGTASLIYLLAAKQHAKK